MTVSFPKYAGAREERLSSVKAACAGTRSRPRIANLDAKLDQVAKDVAQGLRILITENDLDAPGCDRRLRHAAGAGADGTRQLSRQ